MHLGEHDGKRFYNIQMSISNDMKMKLFKSVNNLHSNPEEKGRKDIIIVNH